MSSQEESHSGVVRPSWWFGRQHGLCLVPSSQLCLRGCGGFVVCGGGVNGLGANLSTLRGLRSWPFVPCSCGPTGGLNVPIVSAEQVSSRFASNRSSPFSCAFSLKLAIQIAL